MNEDKEFLLKLADLLTEYGASIRLDCGPPRIVVCRGTKRIFDTVHEGEGDLWELTADVIMDVFKVEGE